MFEARSIREAGRDLPYPPQIRLITQRPDVRPAQPLIQKHLTNPYQLRQL